MPGPPDEAIAVIGLGCVFPGAPDAHAFWRNIEAGADAITEAPESRLPHRFLDPDSDAVDRIYTRRGGFIGEHFAFDALGFGIMPVAAAGAEPDQLLALEVAARTFADAGYDHRTFAAERAGVILGRGGYLTPGLTRLSQAVRGAEELVSLVSRLVPGLPEATLERIREGYRAQSGPYGPDTAIGLVPNLVASRIANRMDLQGAAYTVDAACASALVAVEQACQALRSRRLDLVLAGGVHLVQDVTFWSVFTQLGALSRRGEIRPFDKNADGLLIGEGVGMLLLKRLRTAERDGDRIYAVIRGVGTASDGRARSVMVPRVDGQVLAIERAWRDAGLDPKTVGFVEGHGTATPAGDAAELETLARAFGPAEGQRAVLGSVKSMIGHTMPAAGAASLIKTVLAVHHGVLPPTLHVEEPHPALEATRFRTTATAETWREASGPRRAGVDAFGFGGIDAHVVVESHGERERRRAPRAEDDPEAAMLVLAAESADGLVAALDAGRQRGGSGPCRLVVAGPTRQRVARARQIVRRGEPWRGRGGIWFTPRGLATAGGKLAFLFPGVDAAFEPRVEDVCERFDLPVPAFVQAEGIEEQGLGIVGVSRLLEKVLERVRVRPDAMAGHSVGEWTAMIAGGIIPEADADAFIGSLRAGTLEVPGVLFAAAGCGVETAEKAIEDLPEIAVSHDNCPHQVILCGHEASIEIARARLAEAGVICQVLPFRSGFHSPLFADYLRPHREHFARLPLVPARVPVWSATTTEPFPEGAEEIRALALEHLVEPVRFRALVEAMYADGVRMFVQVGTGRVVGFVEDILKGRPFLAESANLPRRPGLAQLRNLLAALWVEGRDVDLESLLPEAREGGPAVEIALGAPLVELDLPPVSSGAIAPAPAAGGDPVLTEVGETLRVLSEVQGEVLDAWERFSARRVRSAPVRIERRLSLETVPALMDHSFMPQRPGWEVISDLRPVVPMTMILEILLEGARAAAPGSVPVAIEAVRAFRWLEVDKPVDVVLEATPAGPGEVDVSLGDYARGRVRLLPAYPAPPATAFAPLTRPREPAIDASALYAERWMFHGPRYQGVAGIGMVGDDGIDGELVCPEGPGALLDSAGQLFGYWVMDTRNVDRLAMPVGLDRLELFGPLPERGDRLHCEVRVTALDEREVRADMELSRDGRVWARIRGWTDHRFPSDVRLWSVLCRPEDNLLCHVREAYVLYDDTETRPPSRDWLMRRYLGEAERAEMVAAGPRGQRAFLHDRIAAKDALRRYLWEEGAGPIFPAEVRVIADDGGRLSIEAPGADGILVAVAHTGDVAVGIAARGRAPGIAVVPIEARPDADVAARFAPEEAGFLDQEGGVLEWQARLWAAKLAAAQAEGAPDPTRLRIEAVEGRRVRVSGRTVETRADEQRVVAWA